jgi:hypothetical protein
MKKTVVADIVCFLFILLFVYAAISKLIEFDKFRVQLGKSPLLTAFPEVVAWSIPAIEIMVSVFLLYRKTQLTALYTAFTLMVTFSAYIICITKYSYYVPCSCGGILQNMSWSQHLWFNLFFVAIGTTGILFYPTEKRAIGQ